MSKPGEKALLCLEEMKSRQVVPLFKTPKVTTTKNKQKTEILTEEQYVEEIGKIIQRDFFPVRSDKAHLSSTLANYYLCTLSTQDLEKLRAQHQYMEAMERNDTTKLRELYAKFTGGRRPTDRSGESTRPIYHTNDH